MGPLIRRISSIFKPKRDEEKSRNFIHNGGELLADLIAFSNGSYDIPIRTFTAEDLLRSTESFSNHVLTNTIFRGQFEGRKILVISLTLEKSFAVRDIVVASQMSHHKNVLKLVGCCLEFEFPRSVYEYVDGILLSDLLEGHGSSNRLLSWRCRIRIARDIASTILYLHTSFSTPVIYRDLEPSKVIITQQGVAKLFDFSYCISLPPGKLGVEDIVVGTYGVADPEYVESGYVTQKSDVYSFGVLMLTLLTGKTVFRYNHEGHIFTLSEYVKHFADNHRHHQVIDLRILEEMGGVGDENLVLSFLSLALRCIRGEGGERAEMIDVAKQLRLMEKALPNLNA